MSSRTPVNGAGYDKSLLADAPQITRADKQEGYDPELLEAQATSRVPPIPRGGAVTPSRPKYTGTSEEGHGLRNAAVSPPQKTRPRKLIFIAIGVVLLLLVAIGVGVGVGVSKSRSGGSGESVPLSTIEGGQTTPAIGEPTKPVTGAEPTKDPSSPSTPDPADAAGTTPGGGIPNPPAVTPLGLKWL